MGLEFRTDVSDEEKESAMRQVIYCMRFQGHAAPVGGSSTVLRAETSAHSCRMTTTIGPSGVKGSIQPEGGEKAAFESEVRFSSMMLSTKESSRHTPAQ